MPRWMSRVQVSSTARRTPRVRTHLARDVCGEVVEWLGSGLQSRVRGFESRPHLAQHIDVVGAIGAAVARFPDTEEVTGSIPVSRTKENPLALRLRGFVFKFSFSWFAEGWRSSVVLCLFWRRCSVYFLRAVAGNPPSLRFGHPEGASVKYASTAPRPDVTAEDTTPPPACKTLSSSSVRAGLGCAIPA